MNKLQRMDVASSYVDLLKEVDSLRCLTIFPLAETEPRITILQ